MSAHDPAPAGAELGGGEPPAKRFPTVGIGASAGGVHALQQFFESLPEDVEAAFVVVVHLDPEHQSELPAILAMRTKMPVTQVAGRTRLEPGHVYIIPPNRQLLVTDQHLSVAEFDEPRWQRAPIDLFFRSLAAQRGDDFAIVLSGAGSDGAVGIKAVKEAGGVILVQDPEEAEYGSMPRAAIATGLADFVLPVREIAARLPELIRERGLLPRTSSSEGEGEAMQRILSHVRVRTGHDFSKYKKSTVRRRIARRMQVQRTATMSDYLVVLRENAAEAQALFADLLISVTAFFRDPGGLRQARRDRRSRRSSRKRARATQSASGSPAAPPARKPIRSPCCSSRRSEARRPLRDPGVRLRPRRGCARRRARRPVTRLVIEADIAEERLERFFTRENDQYRVTRELRDVVLFASHSLLKDPPFSRPISSPAATC